MGFLAFIVFGLAVGLIARALMPGDQSMGLFATALLGMVGSFVGGTIGSWIYGGQLFELHASGAIGSILGASFVLFVAGLSAHRRAHA